MPALFDPIRFRSITLRNRIAVSPMCQYSSADGFANDWHLVHIGSRAVGGAGLILMEATAVTPEGRITPDDLGLYKEAHIPFLERIARFVTENGCVPGIQLAHAGRKASCASPWKGGQQLSVAAGGWQTLAPSSIPYHPGDRPPVALPADQIPVLIRAFVQAARRALAAGFKVIELHAAHGYLLHQFYSPFSNQRTDAYGGSLENRCRLLLETVRAVREVWPDDLPLFVRISATDWVPGGWTEADSVVLARMLLGEGVDLVDCSSGGNVRAQIPLRPGYQVPFAAQIRKEAGIATGAVGLITDALQAASVIESGQADIVFLARQMLRDPYFPLHAAAATGTEIPWPVQYERADRK